MHRTKILTTAMLGLWFAACAAAPEASLDEHEMYMLEARVAFERDDLSAARVAVADALTYAVNDQEILHARLFGTELMIAAQRFDDAERSLIDLREAGIGPIAVELEGKIAFKRGEFERAAELFRQAGVDLIEPADRRRCEDLVALTEGMSAYAEGRYQDARRRWEDVRNRDLRASLEVVLNELSLATRD